MNFSALLTNSINEGDPQYLRALDDNLLDELELKAKRMALGYFAKYGKLPSLASLERHPEFSIFYNPVFLGDALAAVRDEAVEFLIGRFCARQFVEMREHFDLTSQFPTEELLKVANFVNQARASEAKSIHGMDRDSIYSPLTGGVDFGFSELDRVTGGILKSEVAVLAGRIGIGKSLFACRQAVNWARQGNRVFMVSAEMSDVVLTQRIDGFLGGFNPGIFRDRSRAAELSSLRHVAERELALIKADGGDIIFPQKKSVTIDQIVAEIERVKPDAVIIDGIYLIKASSRSAGTGDWRDTKHVSNEIKQAAMTLDVPVFATTQFNRSAREQGSLESIAYSDAIGQDADLVISASRVENPLRFLVDLEIIKNRNGSGFAITQVSHDWDTMFMTEVEHPVTTIKLHGEVVA